MIEHPNPRGVFPVPPTADEVAEWAEREWQKLQRKQATQRAVQRAVAIVSCSK